MPVIASPYQNYSVALSGAKIVRSALRKLGVIDPDNDLEPGELRDGIECLNDMRDTWNAENLSIPSMTPQTFSITSGTSAYTIGPAETFDMARPPRIVEGQCTIKTTDGLEYPLHVASRDEWAAIYLKTSVSAIPSVIFYDQDSPTGNISFYPVPDQNYSFIFYSPNLLPQIINANEIFYLPPAYSEALKFGLAVRYASEFGQQAPPDVVEIAALAKANIKRQNMPQLPMVRCDDSLSPSSFGWVDSAAFKRGY
jgi:hypothetical protein